MQHKILLNIYMYLLVSLQHLTSQLVRKLKWRANNTRLLYSF